MASPLNDANHDSTGRVRGIEDLIIVETHSHTLHYRDLDVGDIRVLHILPNTSPYLECRLEHVTLSRAPEYIAISYAWGDVEDKAEIIVDGCKLVITRNLYEALHMLRREGEPESVTVWADAICINQQNTQELSAQVSIMAKVYQNAKHTAAWLGPEMETDHLAVELLQHLVEVKDSESDFIESLVSPNWWEHFIALASVFNGDYWDRMWVLQEVKMGKSVRIYCGARWLPWETYRGVSRAFLRFEFDLRGAFKTTVLQENNTVIWGILCRYGPRTLDLEEEHELLDYLGLCRRKHCTDPKDKLYALLGLLPEAIKSHFRPDYSLSVKKVYTDIVEYILRSTQRLDFLPYATRIELNNKHFLPSWIPDWSVDPEIDLVAIKGKHTASSRAAQFALTSAGSSSRTSGGSHIPVRPLQLEIKAIFIGTVNRVGLQVPHFHFDEDILMAFLHWRALIKELGRADERGALCRTMTMDLVEEWSLEQLTEICFHLFSQKLQSELPHVLLDDELKVCSRAPLGISEAELDAFWSKYIENTCEIRRFFMSKEGEVGLSSPNINLRDVICVPLGCITPVILWPCKGGEYKFVCDAYVDGYMYGKAETEWEKGEKDLKTYILV
ncbi:heterokaryon incompatibility protein-domain-containing protein [Nemania sp. FL0031]|nr:heterokaryon incompatibility protein-domain-containing protein [Nemania sp. FL0031]